MSGWRVDYLRHILRQEIAAFLNDAADPVAAAARLKRAFSELRRRLEADPYAVGDPRYELKEARILRCVAIVDGFTFGFGIHAETKTVWIAHVAPPND